MTNATGNYIDSPTGKKKVKIVRELEKDDKEFANDYQEDTPKTVVEFDESSDKKRVAVVSRRTILDEKGEPLPPLKKT